MAMRKQACMIDSDEEDEGGNFLERGSSSKLSMGKSDEDYENGNISETISESSLVGSDDEDGNLSEDEDPSSSFQPENQDETKSLGGSVLNTQCQLSKGNPALNKKVKTKSEVSKTVSKKSTKSPITEENSDDSSAPSTSAKSECDFRYSKFAITPTPKCDSIMEKILASEKNKEYPFRNRLLLCSKSTHSFKNIKSPDPNKEEMGRLNSINEFDPNILHTEQSLTDITISESLLVKKEETDLKIAIKEEIDTSDEKKEDIKLYSIKEEPTDLMDFDDFLEDLREDENFSENAELGQCNIQSKIKRAKRKNEEDGSSSSPKTIKKSKQSHTKNNSNHKEKKCVPTKNIPKMDCKQGAVNATKRQGKFSTYPLAEQNKESDNSLLSDPLGTNKEDTEVSAPKVLSGLGNVERKNLDQISSDLLPIISLVRCDSNYTQLTEPKKKRGRPPKAKNAGSPKSIQSCIKETKVNSVSTRLSARSRQNSKCTKLKQSKAIYLGLSENDSDPPLDNVLKIDDSIIPTINQDAVFDDKDLLCLQQLDDHVVSSLNVQMTAKEINSFIADFLISHQNVFDGSFFQNILPSLSEFLMLCMDEFSELLVRNKKADKFTSKELRQQEVKLAIQSFCEKVSTYSEGFFPYFDSVMYKINQNKTKKGLIIAFVFFLANSLWIKTPKFKGQIHAMRKMIICMCQIKKLNSPLCLAVLTTHENIFNDELRSLLKILLVLQEKNILAIPTTALPETSSNDSIEDVCDSIISLSTNCSNDLTHYEIAAKIVEIFKDEDKRNPQGIHEELNHVLCMLKPNNHESKSEAPEESGFESSCSHSFTQHDRGLVLAENLGQTQVGGLDRLFESYYKSTSSTNEDVKSDLDSVLSHKYNTPVHHTFPMPIDNIEMKVEEVDCDGNVELAENMISNCTPTVEIDSFIPEDVEQDPLSF